MNISSGSRSFKKKKYVKGAVIGSDDIVPNNAYVTPNSRNNNIIGGRSSSSTSAAPQVSQHRVTPCESFYVGKQKYEICEYDQPMQLFQIYMQSIMNLVYGLLCKYNIQDDTDPVNIIQNSSFILSYIFQSILRYNKVILPYTTKLYTSNDSFCLSEPIYFDFADASDYNNTPSARRVANPNTNESSAVGLVLNLYINEDLVHNILNSTASSANITFSEEIKSSNNIFTRPVTANCSFTKYFNHQDIIFKLFVIADHAATHYIQLYKSGETDWVNHKAFGQQNATTVYSIFDVNVDFSHNRETSVPLLASSLGSSNSLPSNCTTSLTSLQRSLFQPAILSATQEFHNTSNNLPKLATISGQIVDPKSLLYSIY